MAINFIKKEDLSHITRTTRQWETTIDRYEIIPKGVLCIELCNDKLTKIKIGNGHLIYEQLPYVSDVNLSDYYTKEETNNLIKDLKAIKIKGEASSLSDLPLHGNEEGDLWFIPKQDPDTHNRYDEYIWYKNKWESFGSSDIDLSEYAKKSYVDTHIQEVQNEITEIIESGYLHKHDNKNILDHTSAVYNVEKDNKLQDLHNYDDTELREKAHTHLNKNILDQTDAVYNRDKDDKLRGLHNYDDTSIKQRLSSLESVAHSHSNQDVLDRTTAAFTKEQALTLLDCKDFKGTDGVHDGYHGFVPAPTKDDIGKVLGANGEWVEGGSSGGDTITEGGGIEITTDSQTGVKTVSVNAGTGLEIDQQTGELNVTATGGDTIAEGNGIDITTDSQTGVKTISVDIGNGLQFNQNSEIDIKTGDGLSVNQNNALDINTGEGLQINQNNELEVSLGNGLSINNNNAIELDKATTTTIGGVIVGDNLSIDNTGKISADEYTPGEGISIDSNKEVSVKYNSNGLSINASDELELDKATKNSIGGVIVGDNINVSNGTISVPVATDSSLGVVNPTDGLSVDNTGELSVNTGDGLSINQDNEIGINIGEGLQFNQDNELEVGIGDGLSINASDEVELDKATTSSIGGVIIGDNIDVNNGTISVPKAASNKLGVIKPSDGLSVDSNGALTVDTGDGLSIDSTTKEVNVNVGRALTINQNNDIDVNIASRSAYGVVKVGEGVNVDSNGIISVEAAPPFRTGDGIILTDESERLPSGFTKIEYVESSSTNVAYTSINYYVNANSKFIGKMSKTELTTDGYGNSPGTVFGTIGAIGNYSRYMFGFVNDSGSSSPLYCGIQCGDGTSPDPWYNNKSSLITTFALNDIVNFEASVADGLKLNNELHQTYQVYGGTLPVGRKLGVMGADANGISTGSEFYGRLYFLKIYEGNVLKVSLVPCIQTSSSTPGLYDTVAGTFYESTSGNPFLYDPETIDVEVPDWVLKADIATSSKLGSVKVGSGLSATNDGTLSVNTGDGLTVDNSNDLNINVGDGLFIDSTNNDINVKIGQALSINNSNEIDVNLGQALSINNDNEIDVNTGRALSINNSNAIDVDIATGTSLGVVKVGPGLNIDEFGNLSTQATPYRIGRALSLDDESVRLPAGYAKAKYVENPSNAGIRTGFRPSDYPNAKYVGSVSVESVGSSSTYPTRYVCGASGWKGSLKMPLDGISSGLPIKTFFYIGNGNNPQYTTTTFQLGERFDFEASPAGGFKINNELVQAVATPPSGFGTYFLALFGSGASNGPGEPGFKGRIYYFRIYNTDDTMLANFVPAVRLGDNIVGFYNTVNNTFYRSETSTQFTTDMDDLDVDEPDWVLNADIATAYKLGVIKPSTGLLVDEQGALSLKTATSTILGGIRVGDGLSMDEYGVLSTTITSYSSGHAIEIVGDLSIDKFRWEITENAGGSMVAFRYFEYSDENHDPFTIASGTIEWSDGSTVSFPSGYDETFTGMMENRTKCTVTGWDGVKTLIMTFTLSQSILMSDVGYFRWKTDDYMSGRQPTEFNIYAHDSVNDEWILLKEVTDHSLVPSSGNTWSNYIDIGPEMEPGTINVKYGNGLTLNQNNELEVVGGGGGDTVEAGDGIDIDTDSQTGNKIISVSPATTDAIGGVMIGDGVNIDENGVLSATTYEAGNGISFINHYTRELPTGYTQLEYIESHFDAGFILDYYPQKTSKVVCEAAFVDVNRSNPSDNCLFGSRNGNSSSSKQFVFWFNDRTSSPFSVGFVYTGNSWGDIGDHPTNANMYQRLLFEISPSIGVYCNNVLIQNPLSHPDRDPSPYKFGILCLATSDTGIDTTRNYQSGRIFTFKIYESDTLVVDLVPCLNDSDVPGLYDMVSEVFYPSTSGTDFTYDPDTVVTHDSITIDANRGPGIIYDNNALSLNPGAGLSIDETNNQKLNVNLADGLSIKNTTTNAIKINTGDGLSVDSTTNNLNVNVGDGLVKDSSNNIDVNLYDNDFYINSVNNQIRINPLYAPTYDAGNGIQFVSTTPSLLPAGYTRLTYIESKGTSSDRSASILDYVPTKDTKIDMTFEFIKSMSEIAVVGSQTAASTTSYPHYHLNVGFNTSSKKATAKLLYGKNGAQTVDQFITDLYTPINVVASKDGVFVDGVQVQTVVATDETMPPYKMRIFTMGSGNDTGYANAVPFRIHELKLYEGNVLSAHLIPCLNPNNVPGMYDVVNNVFYQSTWTTPYHYDENDKSRPGYYVQAKLGNGLQFDANNAIEVTGGSGGDTVAEGDGISINTDQQTGDKVISVDTGVGLTVDTNNKLTLDTSVQLIIHCVGDPLT